MKTLVFVDTETGGFDPKVHGITEVGAVAFHFDSGYRVHVTDTWCEQIKPLPGKTYTEEALKIQKRTIESLERDGIDLTVAYPLFSLWLRRVLGDPGKKFEHWSGAIWAHNAPFDWGFLHIMERDCGYLQRAVQDPLAPVTPGLFTDRPYFSCTRNLWLAMRGLEMHDLPKASLEPVSEYLQVRMSDVPQTHTALDDCLLGIRTLSKMRNMMRFF